MTEPVKIFLPDSGLNSRINHIFERTTTSYKFYWFLAILDEIEETKEYNLDMNRLVARMIARAWYPLKYYHLSFGVQDQLADAVNLLSETTGLDRNSVHRSIFKNILRADDVDLQKSMREFQKYVPVRLLTPWFSEELRGIRDHKKTERIKQLADEYFNIKERAPLYRFKDDGKIFMHQSWYSYLLRFRPVLTSFTYASLTEYLSKKNPGIPAISMKLNPPESPDLSTPRKLWKAFFSHEGPVKCIFSGSLVRGSDYALDHYLPRSYVYHDLMWNLIPTLKEVNSSKSNLLPAREYFDDYAYMQKSFFDFHYSRSKGDVKKERKLHDYVQLFKKDLSDISALSSAGFKDELQELTLPSYKNAVHMGFPKNWKYNEK